jgi:hypothetical protein
MIANRDLNQASGFRLAVKYVLDGFRIFRGMRPKYTTDLDTVKTSFQYMRPPLELYVNSVSEVEWKLLKALVEESRQYPGPIVEIGVLAGRTTQQLAAFKGPHQKILAVDNFCWNPWWLLPDEQWGLVKHSLGYLEMTDQVEVLRSDKDEFFKTYQGPAPSLVFLDAMHTYEETKKDIEWAKRVGAKIISGHDYGPEFPGVMQIVDELGGPFQLSGTVWRLQ